jgi:hypothetical protein
MDDKLQRGFETLKAQLNSSQGKMEFGGGMAVGIVPGALVAVADIPYSIFKLLVESGLQTNFGKMSKEEIDKAVENLVAGLKKLGARMPEVIGDIAAQPKEVGSWAAALISERIRQDLFLEEPEKGVEKKRESPPTTNERPSKPSVTDILGIAPGVELPDLYKAARDKITQGKGGGKGGYVFNKGVAAGMALGYTLMNVVMLFIGPEEMAAKAGSLGAKGTEALAASRLWKRLGGIAESIPELKALAGARRAAAEAKAGGTAVKGAEGLAEGGGKAAVRLAEERLPASVAKDVITKEEALIEVEFINKHPERVKGSPPRAELGGEGPTKHEIVQLPDGTCERHSKKMPVPCPVPLKSTGAKSGEVKPTSEESPKLAPGISTGEAAEAAALKPSRPNATLLGEKAGGYDATQGGRRIVNSETPTTDRDGKPIIVRDVTIRGADAIQIKTITQLDKFGQPSKKPIPELVADNVTAAMKKAYNQPVTRARARTPLPGTNIYERTHVESPRKITIIVQVPGPVTPEMRAAAARVVSTDTMAAELPPIEAIVQTKQSP